MITSSNFCIHLEKHSYKWAGLALTFSLKMLVIKKLKCEHAHGVFRVWHVAGKFILFLTSSQINVQVLF